MALGARVRGASFVALSALCGCGDQTGERIERLDSSLACAPITYQGENITHSVGGPTSGGWNLWSNGYVAVKHSFSGGNMSISVRAAGTVANGEWPHMVVYVGKRVIGRVYVTSSAYATYTFDFTIFPMAGELRIEFDNDYSEGGQDRNLLIDSFVISCVDTSSGTAGASAGGASGSGGAGGTSGSGGKAGAGGTSGSGGKAGAGGISGSGGKAGAGGISGSGGKAGAGGISGSGGGGAGGISGSGGTSGSGGGGAGGASGSGGAGGDYSPPTGGYVIKSAALKNPSLMIAHALGTVDFYAKAADNEQGGFYTYLDRQGKPTSTNKSFVVQSRDAYAFVRAFMLSGDPHYLDLAEHALDFLYAHGWDSAHDGFYFMGDRRGNKVADPSGTQSAKWSFVQHYGLAGINAMCEATRSSGACSWLDVGIASLDAHLWDSRPAFLGFYNNANNDFSSRSDKGFTPTIDGITTHALNDFLLLGTDARRQRFFALADNASDRLAASMTASGVKFGFPEDYDSNWVINSGSKFGFVGHVYKTAWCLARAYLIDPREKYRSAARQILRSMYDKGGFDKTNGAVNYSFNWDSGVNSTDKEYWQLEQGILSGIYNHAIADNDADRAVALEVADRTLDFYLKFLPDTEFGGIFYQTNASGSVVRTDKGDQWEGAYHDVELSYYVYVDGNLMLWHRPVTLYYRFEPSASERTLTLSPIPLSDGRLAIASVDHAGAPYTDFVGATRALHLPASSGGVFAVTYRYVAP